MYQPKFRVAIFKLEREVKDKEKELAEVMKSKRTIEGEIDRCKKEIRLFYKMVEKEGSITPFSMSGYTQNLQINQRVLKEQLQKIDRELRIFRKEYQVLTMKRDWLVEKERENERNFYTSIRKKEEREVEEIKRTQEYLKRRG